MLAYDSGSSAKLMRLLGVDCPELGALLPALPAPSTRPTNSGMFSIEGVGVGVCEALALVLVLALGDRGRATPARFIADCRGGDGGRVEDECVPFVKSRETDAVAVDVPACATGGAVRGRNAGGRSACPGVSFGGRAGWSSSILRKLCTVSFATQPSDDEDDSSTGGVIGLMSKGDTPDHDGSAAADGEPAFLNAE